MSQLISLEFLTQKSKVIKNSKYAFGNKNKSHANTFLNCIYDYFQHIPVCDCVHDVQSVLEGLLPPQLTDPGGIQGAV
jgi:hypothetical protein